MSCLGKRDTPEEPDQPEKVPTEVEDPYKTEDEEYEPDQFKEPEKPEEKPKEPKKLETWVDVFDALAEHIDKRVASMSLKADADRIAKLYDQQYEFLRAKHALLGKYK